MALRDGRVNAVLFLLLTWLSGCTSIPVADLNTYDQAFTQARLAGDLLLDQISPIIAEQTTGAANAGCPLDALGVHSCFDPLGVLTKGQSDDPRSILIRRAALQTVADYNGVLLALADGRFTTGGTAQINDIIASSQMLLKLTSVAVPGLPGLLGTAATGALGGLVTSLQNIRSAVEVRQAIIAGAPVIQSILGALARETSDLYAIYLKAKTREIANAATAGSAERKKKAIGEVNAFYDSLAAYVVVLNATSEALNTLANAATNGGGTAADVRAIITSALDIRTKADAFWTAARALPK